MSFVVRIFTDQDVEDLKVFSTYQNAELRFNRAWILMRDEVGQPIADEPSGQDVVGRLRRHLGLRDLTRVELHECKAESPIDAAAEVRQGASTLRHWRDDENIFGDILDDIKL